VPKLAADPVACDRRAYRPAHDETGPGGMRVGLCEHVDDQGGGAGTPTGTDRPGEVLVSTDPPLDRKHGVDPALRGELGATFTATRGDDRAACAGAHAQPEAVRLRSPTVVRLERALAHYNSHDG
jgi:hypothetical protein